MGRSKTNEKEIDFVIPKLNQLIQVTDEMPIGSKTEKREFSSFDGKTGEKLIITQNIAL